MQARCPKSTANNIAGKVAMKDHVPEKARVAAATARPHPDVIVTCADENHFMARTQ
jgi:hypothetical protein